MTYNHRNIALMEVEEFIKINNPQSVLEIGAGANPFHDVFNIEDYASIDKVETRHAIQEDVHDMEFEDSFECVFMCHTAEHFENPVLAWKNIYRALEKGGHVLSITPMHCEHQILKADDDHIFVLTPIQWRRLLKYTGFKNIQSWIQTTWKEGHIPKEQDFNIITVAEK